MTTSYFRPFDYRYDGAFTRASKAWYTTDEGAIVETDADERRVLMRGTAPWIWMEGARENFIEEPLRIDDVAWDIPAADTVVIDTPIGTATVGVGGALVEQEYAAGPEAAFAAGSYYAKLIPPAPPATFFMELTNVGAFSDGQADANDTTWTRVRVNGCDLSEAGAKSAKLTAAADAPTWGVVVESGPGYASDGRFCSQPILETGVREVESFTAGVVTEALLDQRGFRISFEPDFSANVPDCVFGDQFEVVSFRTGVPGEDVQLWLECYGGGDIRVSVGEMGGAALTSGAIEFDWDQRLTFEVLWVDPDEGDETSLTISGATAGNGKTSGGIFFPVLGAEVVVGGPPTLSAFGLVSPLELFFDGFKVGTIDQLTLNSIKVTFVDDEGNPVDVLQFDPRGDTDALNPDHYLITGSPGLPFVQYVQPGDVGSEVVLFFDAKLAPGLTVTISPHDIAMAGDLPLIIGDGSAGGFGEAFFPLAFDSSITMGLSLITFGNEVNLVTQEQATFPRVDIANPQTERDAEQGASLGTFSVTDPGDLANDHGRTYLRKRVLRRLATAKDGFFHLPGYGLDQPAKLLFTPTTLRRLKVDCEAQVRQEPGVVAVLATLSELRPGVVAIKLRIQDDNGSFELEDALDFNAE